MNRRECKDCIFQTKTYDGELFCQRYRHWLREGNKQISIEGGFEDKLCDFQPIVGREKEE